MTPQHTRFLATAAAVALVASACGTSDASGGATDDVITEATAANQTPDSVADGAPTSDTTGSDDSSTAEKPPDDANGASLEFPPCPAPPKIPELESADSTASPIPGSGEPVTSGRYVTTSLGLSLAIDVDEFFEEASDGSEVVGFFDGQGPSAFSLQRPEGFIVELPTDEETARGAEIELVDFEAWLAKPGIEVVSEQQIEIDGYPARDLQVLASEEAAGEFGDIPLTPSWTMQSSDDISRRLVYVDVGDSSPLLITAEQPSESDVFEEAVEAMITSIAIGGVGPSAQEVFSETPWDIGNIFDPAPVGLCTVPAVAFGGVEFELSEPSMIEAQGDQLWVRDPAETFEGTREPSIELVRPVAAQLGGDAGPPSRGNPIVTIEDALAEYEADGFTLTERSDSVTLLGAEAQAYDFVGPSSEPWLWFAGDNDLSNGFGFISGEPNRQGIIYIAETEQGIVVLTLDAEQGTDDLAILQDRFDTIAATLTST